MSTQVSASASATATAVADRPAVIHVVDDEVAIQDLFREIGRGDEVDVRCYGCAADFLDTFDASQPGCLVLDLNLPDMSGLQVLEELTRRDWRIPVLFISAHARVSEAVRALQLGGIDFLEKPFDLAAMAAALQRGLAEDRDRRNQARQRSAMLARLADLTPREREVMDLVVQGMANKAVAAALGVRPKTVEVHRANVMRKTATESLAGLVRLHLACR
jgi:two-component system response regulator TtrR